MSERGRVALIFGTIGALGLGGGYYYFGVMRPREVKTAAQTEIAAWEQRWTAARTCLLGKTPGSPRTSEALAIHELSPDPWDRGTCTALMAKLVRGDSPDTGLPRVEAAWRELDHAASKAAQAFAEHASGVTLKTTLPAALDALDAARLALRSSAGLPDDDGQRVPPLPAADVTPLAIGGTRVASIDAHPHASAHGLFAFGKATTGADVQVELPIDGAPSVAYIAAGALRAVPDGSWGAGVTSDGALAIGAVGSDGGIAAPIATTATGVTEVVAALGTLADGTVLYSGQGTFGVAHVKGTAVTLEPPVPVAAGAAAVDLDGRAVAWWSVQRGDDTAAFARAFGFGAPGPLSLGASTPAAACLGADRAWLVSTDGIAAIGAGSGAIAGAIAMSDETVPSPALVGCTRDAAIVDTAEPDRMAAFARCTTDCKPFPRTPPANADAYGVAGDQIVGATVHGSVLAVWRGPAAAAFYSLSSPANARIAALYGGAKSIDLVVEGDGGVALARVPLK